MPPERPEDCLALIASMSALLRMVLAPVMPRDWASCLSSGNSIPESPEADLPAVAVAVSLTCDSFVMPDTRVESGVRAE